MSNPFPARFNSKCNSCGDPIYEGEDTFAVDGNFVCKGCAEANDNVCECGSFKKNSFEKCFYCHNEEEIDYDSPPF